ncbi:MAG: UMP kinase [bacterium JZ-2024 1]
MERNKVVYNRVVLKLSGEILGGGKPAGIDYEAINEICDEIAEASRLVQMAIVIGGGNLFRGTEAAQHGVDRVTADYAGMLATVMNSLILQSILEKKGVQTRVQTAFEIRSLAEPYIRRRALRHLEKGRVVIFSGGTGRPYFSTDTAAALCAAEIHADVLLKATKVDGIFSADPGVDKDAVFFPEITYKEILQKSLQIMDATAISMSMSQTIPLIVFNIKPRGNLLRILRGEHIGTRVGV